MTSPDPVHRKTVFIVDDDAAVRDALALFLSLRGYPTAVFARAEDFLRALAPHWRGVVVVDIRMPGMSGLEMQEALAQHPAQLPVIIITAHGDLAAARHAFASTNASASPTSRLRNFSCIPKKPGCGVRKISQGRVSTVRIPRWNKSTIDGAPAPPLKRNSSAETAFRLSA